MSEIRPDERTEYWRGLVDAKLSTIDAAILANREHAREAREEFKLALQRISDDMTRHVGTIEQDMKTLSVLVYKVVGVGMVLAALLPLVWPKIFGGVK